MTAEADPPPVRSPRHAFVRYWLARVASGLGFQMLSVAIGWQIYALRGRALDLGLIGLVQFFPSVLLALPAGHLADRHDRRRIVLGGQCIELAAVVALAVLTLRGHLDEAGILWLVLALSTAKALESPAMQSLLPALVSPAALPRAVASTGAAYQAAMIVGPALGGLLYLAGPGVVHLVAAACYLLAVLLVAGLPGGPLRTRREPLSLATFFAGIHYIRRHRDLLGVISLDLFAVLLGGATALLPIFARDILHTGPWGLGILRAAPALGAVLTSLWLSRHALERHVGRWMFGAVAGFGVATLVFAVSTTLWLSVLALGLAGAFDMVSMVIRGSLVQLDTPDAMRGRVNAVNGIFINTSNQLGEFESGLLAACFGAVGAVLIGGIGTLLVVALWMRLFPGLRQRQRLRMEDPELETLPGAQSL
ncbi:MAG: MFS transporter [Fulvimonas sp.]|nr:MFS transporter [Fulvimonas sp.]